MKQPTAVLLAVTFIMIMSVIGMIVDNTPFLLVLFVLMIFITLIDFAGFKISHRVANIVAIVFLFVLMIIIVLTKVTYSNFPIIWGIIVAIMLVFQNTK